MKNKKEDKKNKKWKSYIILIPTLLLLTLVIVIIYRINNTNKEQENPNESEDIIINTEEGVIGDKEVEGLSLTSTSLIYKDGVSTLETLVTNNNETSYYLEEFHIIVKDESGNDIINYIDEEGNTINYLVGYVGEEIPAKGSTTITTAIDFDISSLAYTVSYEIVK